MAFPVEHSALKLSRFSRKGCRGFENAQREQNLLWRRDMREVLIYAVMGLALGALIFVVWGALALMDQVEDPREENRE